VTAQHLVGFGVPAGMSTEQFARTMTTTLRLLKRMGVR
jgi:hypothetical protein